MARIGRLRMIGGSLSGGASCPSGFFCMDTGTVLLTIVVVLALCAIGVFIAKQQGLLQFTVPKPTVVVVNRESPPLVQLNSDPRFAPLAPERSFGAPPDMGGLPIPAGIGAMPINRQTRGLPQSYQQVGVLTTQGGTANSGTPTRTILPLFGRALDSARNKWNYYTRTDGMNPVQVPVQFKRRNCDDDYGCDEILDGDGVGVPVMGQSFVANVYRYSTPRYIPM